jgi:hypothetical protein
MPRVGLETTTPVFERTKTVRAFKRAAAVMGSSLSFQYFLTPLWSSGQNSWLQIWRPVFDSRHYQKKKVVGVERGPLSLVSTTEELLDRKVAAPV